jgi:NodT family efflux transporter outer membrane factor (OMF) lipoprotein
MKKWAMINRNITVACTANNENRTRKTGTSYRLGSMTKDWRKIISPVKRYVSGLMIVLALSGCATVGPDYVRPEVSIPDKWNAETGASLNDSGTDAKTLSEWWSTLNDPELTSLIERAIQGNLDLRKATARVREARARRGITNADIFPTLDAGGSASWSYSSKDKGTGKTSDLYSASFDAGWELDIFGSIRRSIEASQADLEASQEDLRDALVSLLAEVAVNYVEVRTYQDRIAVAEANISVQKETYQLTLWRYQAGLSDDLAVQQARYNLESTQSQIPTLRTGIEEAMNRIAVLLGEQPGKVHEELKKSVPIPSVPLKVAVGVPADVLRRRPDVRRAERELAAQTARVGVATADLYPKLSLSGSIGLEALSLNGLFSSATKTVTGGSLISWPIFRGGSIRQNIEVQSALQEQALIQYEAAVLSALEEVENALVAYAEEQVRRDVLREGEQAAQKAAELAQHKYEAGLTDFNNVLDAQRSLLTFQDQLSQSNGTVIYNLVRLYKALGGGWESIAPNEENR